MRLRGSADIFFVVATDNGRDLSGTKICGVDSQSLAHVQQHLASAARAIRTGADPAFEQSRGLLRRMPFFLLKPVIASLAFGINSLGLDFPGLGFPRDPASGAIVTSVGMFGIESGFAALSSHANASMIAVVTAVKKRPLVVEDRVEARPVLRICLTMDHRIIDGYLVGRIVSSLRELASQPEMLLTEDERAQWKD